MGGSQSTERAGNHTPPPVLNWHPVQPTRQMEIVRPPETVQNVNIPPSPTQIGLANQRIQSDAQLIQGHHQRRMLTTSLDGNQQNANQTFVFTPYGSAPTFPTPAINVHPSPLREEEESVELKLLLPRDFTVETFIGCIQGQSYLDINGNEAYFDIAESLLSNLWNDLSAELSTQYFDVGSYQKVIRSKIIDSAELKGLVMDALSKSEISEDMHDKLIPAIMQAMTRK